MLFEVNVTLGSSGGPIGKVMGFIKNMGSKATSNSKVKFEKFKTKMSELTASMREIFNSVSKKKKVKNNVLDVIKDFGCFVKGTEVLTSEGYKAIETIKVGDLVYSKNIETNEVELKRVYSLYTGIKRRTSILDSRKGMDRSKEFNREWQIHR